MPRKTDTTTKDRYHEPFPERLRELMRLRKITQEEIKDVLGLAKRQSVTGYVNGSTAPTDDKIIALAKQYNVSADWLLGMDESMTRDSDIAGAAKLTKLSERAVNSLKDNICPEVLSAMLETNEFMLILALIYDLYEHASMLSDLLDILDATDPLPPYTEEPIKSFVLLYNDTRPINGEIRDSVANLIEQIVPTKNILKRAKEFYDYNVNPAINATLLSLLASGTKSIQPKEAPHGNEEE